MRVSLVTRAVRACFATTLVFSLSLAPSFARMGGPAGGSFARSTFGMGHFSHFAPHGFNRRFDARWFGVNRFGPNRFNRFGYNRFNRFGFNRFGGSPLFVGGWGWGGWGGDPAPVAASEPIVVGAGAPLIITMSAPIPVRVTPEAPIVEAASSTSSTTTATANMWASVRSRCADCLSD
jgi:hypothetical protein